MAATSVTKKCRQSRCSELGHFFFNKKARLFVLGKPLQPSLIFASKTRSLPERFQTRGRLGLTTLKKLVRDKHTSLFGRLINCGCKELYDICDWSYLNGPSLIKIQLS